MYCQQFTLCWYIDPLAHVLQAWYTLNQFLLQELSKGITYCPWSKRDFVQELLWSDSILTAASKNVQDNHLTLCEFHALELFLKFNIAHHFVFTFPLCLGFYHEVLQCRFASINYLLV